MSTRPLPAWHFSEPLFRARVARRLRRQGWKVQEEFPTAYGRLDIFAARRSGETRIIEVKLHVNQDAHARGLTEQLLRYGLAFPSASLWFVVLRTPAERHLAYLAERGIRQLEHPATEPPLLPRELWDLRRSELRAKTGP
jgi:RecB family endonuclease NucS